MPATGPQSVRMIPTAERWLRLFARIGAVTLPVILLAAAVALRLDARIGLPMWLRGGLFLGLGLAFGLALWGWFLLRPRRAAIAWAATVFAGLSLVLMPDIRSRAVRFIVPWYQPPSPLVRARIVVPSGDAVIRRGDAVTLTAYVEGGPQHRENTFPAYIVWQAADGPEQSEPLTRTPDGVLRYRFPAVTQSTTYRFRVGDRVSAWHSVEVVDPVTWTDAARVTIRTGAHVPESFPLANTSVLRCGPESELVFSLAFTRRPVQLRLEWQPQRQPQGAPALRPQLLPVRLSVDGRSAVSQWKPTQSGTVTIRLLAEHGYATVHTVSVQVAPDTPPHWVAVAGWNRFVPSCPPGAAIPVSFVVEDDRGIDRVWVEMATERPTVSGEEPQRLPVPIETPGATQVTGRVRIPLPDGLRPGDGFRMRLAAQEQGSDRVSYYPAEGWGTLHIHPTAAAVWEQAIHGEHAQIHRVLLTARHDLAAAAQSLVAMKRLPDGTIPWTLDFSIRLGNVRQDVERVRQQLNPLTEDVHTTPDLQALAQALSTMKDQWLPHCERSLRAAIHDPDSPRRTALCVEATTTLEQTAQQLDLLAEWSAEAAAIRLAYERLAALIAVSPTESVPGVQTSEATQARQRDRLRTLTAILQDTPPLIAAMREQQQREGDQFAHRLQQLAAEQVRLDAAITQNQIAWQQQSLAATVERQHALIAESQRWAARTAVPLQIAGVAAFDPTALLAAEQLLRQRRLPDALIEQEKAARELDRIAVALTKAADARHDTREALRQLTHWQANIHTRFTDADSADGHTHRAFHQDEQVLLRLLEQIVIPHSDKPLTARHAEAVQAVRHAADMLCHHGAGVIVGAVASARAQTDTDAALAQAETALLALTERFPTREDRLRQTRLSLERVLRDYRLLIGAIEAVPDSATSQPRLPALAARFAGLTQQMQELDLPGLEPRRTAILAGLQRLAADVQAERRYDIAVSRRGLQLQLDWLRQAVSGATPEDEQAQALFRLQQQFQKAVESTPTAPDAPERHVWRVTAGELSRQYQALTVLAVLPLLEDVRESARQTVREAQSASAAEWLTGVRATTAQMSRLVSRLSGTESDRERVKELVQRTAAAAQRERFAPRLPPTPQEINTSRLALRALRSLLDWTRTGSEVAARDSVERALTRLQEADSSERHPALYQALATATQRLADAMTAQGDSTPPATTHPIPHRPMDPAEAAPEGTLPRRSTAGVATRLAQQQRAIRDRVSALHARFALGLAPSGRDPFGERLAAFVPFVQKLRSQPERVREIEELREQMRNGDPALWETIPAIRKRFFGIAHLSRDFAALTDGLPPAETGFPDLATRQTMRQDEIRTAIQQLAESLAERAQLGLPGLESTVVVLTRSAEQLRSLDALIRAHQTRAVVSRCQAVADGLRGPHVDAPPVRLPLAPSADGLIQAVAAIRASVRPQLPLEEQKDARRRSLTALTTAMQALRTALRTPIPLENGPKNGRLLQSRAHRSRSVEVFILARFARAATTQTDE